MKRIISFDTSVMFSLFLLGILILFHGCILIGILFFDYVPLDFLWGGKMTSVSQLLSFEIVSLLTSGLFFFLLLIRSNWLRLPKLIGVARVAIWVVFILFLLNTIGNLMATNRKILATPLSGLIAWLLVGISGLIFPDRTTVWVLFIATGGIVYLALFISKLTGENFLDKTKPKNEFDQLFLFTVIQAVLIYAVAIPFFMKDYTSLPLTVGILTGTMWMPFTWVIKHWVGAFHAILRTVVVLSLWYIFPEDRFVAIPFAIVVVYLITLFILYKRRTQRIKVK